MIEANEIYVVGNSQHPGPDVLAFFRDCKLRRAKELRKWICEKGFRLNELLALEWYGYPNITFSEDATEFRGKDKFQVLPVCGIDKWSRDFLKKDLRICQRPSGLWHRLETAE